MKVVGRFELPDKGFADLGLTTWRHHHRLFSLADSVADLQGKFVPGWGHSSSTQQIIWHCSR